MIINDLGECIDLSGRWKFSSGYAADDEPIDVPGCWEAQGHSKYLEGPVWYRRSVDIPAAWFGKQILLECAAVSYACRVFCNGVEVGQHLGLWTPFTIDLSSNARTGAENLLALEVYKPGSQYPTRSSLAGFLPDVATTFGGIWQPVVLRAVSCALVDPVIQTDYDKRQVNVRVQAANFDRPLRDPFWQVVISSREGTLREQWFSLDPNGILETSLALPCALPWHPDHPELFSVQVTLFCAGEPVAQVTRRTGFRKLSANGEQLLLNGQPFMIRGILSWGWEPDRIAPSYTAEQARAELRNVRAMGFNLVKLCLVVPNSLYFEVADQEGVLIWEELPMWLPKVNDQLRVQAPREYAEIARMLAHHPSVALYSLGCELNQEVDGPLLSQMNQAVRGAVQDTLVCDNSGSGESYGGLDFDFADFTDYHPYYDLQFFEPLLDNWRRDWQARRPWIFGEFCDSDTFRDLSEIIQANGGSRPWWLTRENPVTTWRSEPQAVLEWEDRVRAADSGFLLHQMLDVSYQQSYTIRKYTLEALRRRQGMGGYIVTGLRDTPISTSGVWDDFGRPKWSAEAFRQINDDAILMLDVVRRRQWHHGGDRPDRVDMYNFWAGEHALWYILLHDTGQGVPASARLEWTLQSTAGEQIASGSSQTNQEVPRGVPQQVGQIQVHLPQVDQPVQCWLEARLTSSNRSVSNRWPIWVYPPQAPLPAALALFDPTGVLSDFSARLKGVPRMQPGRPLPENALLLATSLTPAIWQGIAEGARVLLLQQGDEPLPVRRCPFWREAIKLFPEHSIWSWFPQQGFSDLQFFGLACDLAFDTARLPAALPAGAAIRPILRRLDAREFHISEYLFETRFGKGLLLACTLRLQGGMGAQPVGLYRNVAGGSMLSVLLDQLIRLDENQG